MRDVGDLAAVAGAEAAGAAGVGMLATEEVEDRPVGLVGLDVGAAALGDPEVAVGEFAVALVGAATAAEHVVAHPADVVIAALVVAGDEVAGPLGAVGGDRVGPHLRVAGGEHHLRDQGVAERDGGLGRVDAGRADRRAPVGRGDLARFGVELAEPGGAADAAHLAGQHEDVDRAEDRPAPGGEADVDRADLVVGADVVPDQFAPLLADRGLDRVGAAVPVHRDLLHQPVGVGAVGDRVERLLEGALAGVERPPHHALDDRLAVLVDEAEDPRAGGVVAGDRRPQVEREVLRGARTAPVERLHVRDDLVALDDLEGRKGGRVPEGVFGVGAEGAGDGAADVVLVGDVGDPAEDFAVDEDRAHEADVGLVGGADDRVVAEPHVAVDDPFAAVFEDVAGHHVEHSRHVLQARPEVEELGVLGHDAGLEIADLDRDLGDGEVLDLAHVLGVGVPEPVAHDLVGDRVDLGLGLGVELQVRRHLDRAGRVEGVVGPVPELRRPDRAALGGGRQRGGVRVHLCGSLTRSRCSRS